VVAFLAKKCQPVVAFLAKVMHTCIMGDAYMHRRCIRASKSEFCQPLVASSNPHKHWVCGDFVVLTYIKKIFLKKKKNIKKYFNKNLKKTTTG